MMKKFGALDFKWEAIFRLDNIIPTVKKVKKEMVKIIVACQ
jgi:hypothetical protein